jgi:DNA primase
MTHTDDLAAAAVGFHEALPHRIREYLNGRGIPDGIISRYRLGWNDRRITIPITNRDGIVSFFKLAKDPQDESDAPKMVATPGGSAELYGWQHVRGKTSPLIICEGEFDRLVLEARGFPAVTSTGGCGVFRKEWAKEFVEIPEVYICFDNDEPGRDGATRIGQMIPHAKLVTLPDEVGPAGDVTDFFVRLGKSNDEFLALLREALPAPKISVPAYVRSARGYDPDSPLAKRIARLKASVSIVEVVGQYVDLRIGQGVLRGHCPFHEDGTPSFTVYPATGTFHCYGCRAHGDVIAFLMEAAQLTFFQALQALEEHQHNDAAA